MPRNSLTLVLATLLLAGCGRGLSHVESAAEGARISTERMIDRAEADSNARQARIFAEAAQMEREDVARRDGPRFEVRKDGAGENWTIYDMETGQPARVGTQVMTGLSRQQAAANLSNMQDEYDASLFRR